MKEIIDERKKQIRKGYTPEYDLEYNSKGQLTQAAAYLVKSDDDINTASAEAAQPEGWDYLHWMDLVNKAYPERLVVAAALILAELDRLEAEKIKNSFFMKPLSIAEIESVLNGILGYRYNEKAATFMDENGITVGAKFTNLKDIFNYFEKQII